MAKDYNQLFLDALADISERGMSIKRALENRMSNQKFFELIDENEDNAKLYARATQVRTELKFDSIQRDYEEAPAIDPLTGKIDSAWVQLQRLKIDSKKWELSKLMPKKYGDRVELEHSGQIDSKQLSEKEYQERLDKARKVIGL